MGAPNFRSFMPTLPDGQIQSTSYYLFKEVGDELPLHKHDFWHSCCCVQGECEVYDDTGKSIIIKPPQFVELKAKQMHAIKALQPNTITIHVREPGY